MSSFTWLAHSEGERRRVLDVIRLLDEPGTVDNIGIGGIRDAFSDLLFPGTSVVQTRARYFLFIPWMYRELERKTPVKNASSVARWSQISLIEALLESDDQSGVIGQRARANLNSLPSGTYWQGLGVWGIRRVDIPLHAYHRRLEMPAVQRAAELDGEPGERFSIWHAALPDPPEDFPKKAEMALTREEAEYLRDRIMTLQSGTLLAALISEPESFVSAYEPWALAETLPASTPQAVRDHLHHAEMFSRTIHGAQLLYNLMVNEAAERDDWIVEFRERLSRWTDLIEERWADVREWGEQRPAFWATVRQGNPRLTLPAKRFVDSWIDLVIANEPRFLADLQQARELFDRRELAIKRRLARLHNRSAIEAWLGASGADQLFFRWPTVRTLLGDIVKPLTEPS